MTDTDDRPSIAELQRLALENSTFDAGLLLAELPHDLEAAGYKPSVTAEIVALVKSGAVLLEIAAAALAWRGPPGGGRSDAEIIGMTEVLIETLEKVRP